MNDEKKCLWLKKMMKIAKVKPFHVLVRGTQNVKSLSFPHECVCMRACVFVLRVCIADGGMRLLLLLLFVSLSNTILATTKLCIVHEDHVLIVTRWPLATVAAFLKADVVRSRGRLSVCLRFVFQSCFLLFNYLQNKMACAIRLLWHSLVKDCSL